MNSIEQDSPAERVLKEIQLRLRCSRSRFEVELLKAIFFSAGITSVSNRTNKEFVIKK